MTLIPEHFPDITQQEARLERALAVFPASEQKRIRAAYTFATRAHKGQERFSTAGHIPYVIHPIRVACSLVDEFGERNADALVAALLHDVVEDCDVSLGTIAKRFGPRVRQYVTALTWRKGGPEAKWAQIDDMLREPRIVRLIKASDTIDNSRSMWHSADRDRVLRWIYGYGHWGRRIVESVGAPATIFLDAALAKSTTIQFGHDPDPPFVPNAGKSLTVDVKREEGRGKSRRDGTIRSLVTRHSSLVTAYARYPVRTRVVASADDLEELIREYAVPYLHPGDLLAISERIVAITQGRAYPISDIHPSRWATFLVRFVTKSPYGIGLASPWTMELAIREAGLPRMLFAAVVAAFTKPFGLRGMFYRVVGTHINAIDGPCEYTIPLASGERYAKLGPKDPEGVAEHLAREIGVDIAIIDANDIGVNVLGVSEGVDRAFVRAVFKDNPLGQSDEQTPMAIVRGIRH